MKKIIAVGLLSFLAGCGPDPLNMWEVGDGYTKTFTNQTGILAAYRHLGVQTVLVKFTKECRVAFGHANALDHDGVVIGDSITRVSNLKPNQLARMQFKFRDNSLAAWELIGFDCYVK